MLSQKQTNEKTKSLAKLLVKHGIKSAQLEELALIVNGGKGSGNFGHSGRPGKIGGSSTSGRIDESKTGFTADKQRPDAKTKSVSRIEKTPYSINGKNVVLDGHKITTGEDIKDYEKDSLKKLCSGDCFYDENQNPIKRTVADFKNLSDEQKAEVYKKYVNNATQVALNVPHPLSSEFDKELGHKFTEEDYNYLDTIDKLKQRKDLQIYSTIYDKPVIKEGYYQDYKGEVFKAEESVADLSGFGEASHYEQVMKNASGDKLYVGDTHGLRKVTKKQAINSLRSGETLGGISKSEERIIKQYTYATPQNSALRQGKSIDEVPSAIIMKDIIDRTKGIEGTFYRGVNDSVPVNLKVGDTYSDKGFMSTSRSMTQAMGFASGRSDNGTLFEIKGNGQSGTNFSVSDYSFHPAEQEVLFNAGLPYRVTAVKKPKNGQGLTVINLELK